MFVDGVITVTSGVEDFCDLEDLAFEAFLLVAMNDFAPDLDLNYRAA